MAQTIQDSTLQTTNKPDQRQRTGSGFTNIGRILEANRSNRLGSAVGGGIQQSGQQAKAQIGQAQQQFGQQAEAGRLDTEANKAQVEQGIQAANTGNITDQQAQDFSKFRAGEYAGPSGLKDSAQISSAAQGAESLGRMAGDAGGRQTLLQRFVGGPRAYTAGQQRLDSMLLGRQGGQDLAQARRAVSGLGTEANRAIQGSEAQAGTFKNLARAFGKETEGRIEAENKPVLDQLRARKEEAARLFEENKNRYQSGLQRGEMSQADIDALGLGDISNIYDTDLTNYLNTSNLSASELGVADQEEAAKLNALARLGGKDQFGDVSKAGEFLKDQFKFDKDRLSSDIKKREQGYTQERDQILQDENYKFLADSDRGLKNESDRISSEIAQMDKWTEMAQKYGAGSPQANEEAKIFSRMTGKLPAGSPMAAIDGASGSYTKRFLENQRDKADQAREENQRRLDPYQKNLASIDSRYGAGRSLKRV